MTYSPLMDLVNHRLPASPLQEIAQKYSKTVAQVVLRWNIQRGCIPLPKSSSPFRLKENINILDFELNDEEISKINTINVDYQYLPESMYCPGL